VRERSHSLALTLESQRAQLASLSQALERMGTQRGQLDSRLGELHSQLDEGDSPVDRCRPSTRTRWKSACAPIAC
jgi:chromosome segregation protein